MFRCRFSQMLTPVFAEGSDLVAQSYPTVSTGSMDTGYYCWPIAVAELVHSTLSDYFTQTTGVTFQQNDFLKGNKPQLFSSTLL